jgi:hypothetical protein
MLDYIRGMPALFTSEPYVSQSLIQDYRHVKRATLPSGRVGPQVVSEGDSLHIRRIAASNNEVEEDEMGGTCSTYGGENKLV